MDFFRSNGADKSKQRKARKLPGTGLEWLTILILLGTAIALIFIFTR